MESGVVDVGPGHHAMVVDVVRHRHALSRAEVGQRCVIGIARSRAAGDGVFGHTDAELALRGHGAAVSVIAEPTLVDGRRVRTEAGRRIAGPGRMAGVARTGDIRSRNTHTSLASISDRAEVSVGAEAVVGELVIGRAGGGAARAALGGVTSIARGTADVVAGRKPSAGQAVPVPVHFSATSQAPLAARQTVVADANPSAGQAALRSCAGLRHVAGAVGGAADRRRGRETIGRDRRCCFRCRSQRRRRPHSPGGTPWWPAR